MSCWNLILNHIEYFIASAVIPALVRQLSLSSVIDHQRWSRHPFLPTGRGSTPRRLCTKSPCRRVAASPPRCASGLCLAVKTTLNAAAAPLVRALPQGFWTKGRTRGAAPMKKRPLRQGRALPHIGAAKPLRPALPHIGAAKPLRTDFLCRALHDNDGSSNFLLETKPRRSTIYR